MIEWIISSSVIISIVITLRFLFWGKISRRLQYALWGLVLLRLLLPFPLLESPLSIMNIIPQNSFEEKQIYILSASQQSATEVSSMSANSTGAASNTNSSGHALLTEDESSITCYLKKMSQGNPLPLLWLIGSIAVGVWFIRINIMFYRRLRKSRQHDYLTDCKLPVYVTDQIASPCLFGIVHPSVYLTAKAAASQDSIHYVLTHEESHYRHGDHIWSILRGLCLVLWWWNPLVWVAVILSRQDSELACDEAVIKQIGKENRLAYGYTLVDMVAVKNHPSGLMHAATTMVSGKRSLKGRLDLIIKSPKTFLPAIAAVLLIIVLSAGCTFTGSSGVSEDVQGLGSGQGAVSYSLIEFKEGETLHTLPLSDNDVQLAENIVMDYMIKSAAWPSIDLNTLREYYLLKATYTDGTTKNYYIFLLDGKAVLQPGSTSLYSRINDELYERLVKLAKSSTSKTGSENDLINTTSRVDRTDLDSCVGDVILSANSNAYKKSDFAAQAHTILKTVEKRNTTIVYAMALYMEFGYAGSGFFETGGSHIPVAITFEKSTAGEYELQEYWRPKDGSGYAPSIKKKFPFDIHKDALDTQKYIVGHIQTCYEQAIQFGKVNTDVEIAKLIEIITSSPAYMSNPQAYIEAHPIEYRELIYYGSHTLRYCFNLFEQGGQTGLAGHIMASACRDILGEDGDLLADTGQYWYDAYRKSTQDLQQQHGDGYITINKPGSWLLLQMLESNYTGEQ